MIQPGVGQLVQQRPVEVGDALLVAEESGRHHRRQDDEVLGRLVAPERMSHLACRSLRFRNQFRDHDPETGGRQFRQRLERLCRQVGTGHPGPVFADSEQLGRRDRDALLEAELLLQLGGLAVRKGIIGSGFVAAEARPGVALFALERHRKLRLDSDALQALELVRHQPQDRGGLPGVGVYGSLRVVRQLAHGGDCRDARIRELRVHQVLLEVVGGSGRSGFVVALPARTEIGRVDAVSVALQLVRPARQGFGRGNRLGRHGHRRGVGRLPGPSVHVQMAQQLLFHGRAAFHGLDGLARLGAGRRRRPCHHGVRVELGDHGGVLGRLGEAAVLGGGQEEIGHGVLGRLLLRRSGRRLRGGSGDDGGRSVAHGLVAHEAAPAERGTQSAELLAQDPLQVRLPRRLRQLVRGQVGGEGRLRGGVERLALLQKRRREPVRQRALDAGQRPVHAYVELGQVDLQVARELVPRGGLLGLLLGGLDHVHDILGPADGELGSVGGRLLDLAAVLGEEQVRYERVRRQLRIGQDEVVQLGRDGFEQLVERQRFSSHGDQGFDQEGALEGVFQLAALERGNGRGLGRICAALLDDGQLHGGLLPGRRLGARALPRLGDLVGQIHERPGDAFQRVGHAGRAQADDGVLGVGQRNEQGRRVFGGDGSAERGRRARFRDPVFADLVRLQLAIQQPDRLHLQIEEVGMAVHVQLLVGAQHGGQLEDAGDLLRNLRQGFQLQQGLRRQEPSLVEDGRDGRADVGLLLRGHRVQQGAVGKLGLPDPLAGGRGGGHVIRHGADRVAGDMGIAGLMLRLAGGRGRNGLGDVQHVDRPVEHREPLGIKPQRTGLLLHLDEVDDDVQQGVADGHAVQGVVRGPGLGADARQRLAVVGVAPGPHALVFENALLDRHARRRRDGHARGELRREVECGGQSDSVGRLHGLEVAAAGREVREGRLCGPPGLRSENRLEHRRQRIGQQVRVDAEFFLAPAGGGEGLAHGAGLPNAAELGRPRVERGDVAGVDVEVRALGLDGFLMDDDDGPLRVERQNGGRPGGGAGIRDADFGEQQRPRENDSHDGTVRVRLGLQGPRGQVESGEVRRSGSELQIRASVLGSLDPIQKQIVARRGKRRETGRVLETADRRPLFVEPELARVAAIGVHGQNQLAEDALGGAGIQ